MSLSQLVLYSLNLFVTWNNVSELNYFWNTIRIILLHYNRKILLKIPKSFLLKLSFKRNSNTRVKNIFNKTNKVPNMNEYSEEDNGSKVIMTLEKINFKLLKVISENINGTTL